MIILSKSGERKNNLKIIDKFVKVCYHRNRNLKGGNYYENGRQSDSSK